MARSQHLHKEKENLNISRALVEYIQQVLKATGQDQIPHELGDTLSPYVENSSLEPAGASPIPKTSLHQGPGLIAPIR